jgi:hypothetical protein
MKLSEIFDVVETQRLVLDRQKPGLIRKALEALPDIQTHALLRLYTYLVSNAAQLVSPATILEYFSCFEASYLIALISCFS